MKEDFNFPKVVPEPQSQFYHWDRFAETDVQDVPEVAGIAGHWILPWFPELLFEKICIGIRNSRYTMAAAAIPDRVRGRVYILFIGCGRNNQVPYSGLTHEMKIGLIAHEICHFVQYRQRTDLGLFSFAIRYKFSRSFRRRIEREADMMAIGRGFGRQLHEFAKHCEAQPFTDERYRRMKRTIYMSPAEIMRETIKHEANVTQPVTE